jgi:hypothetical protein
MNGRTSPILFAARPLDDGIRAHIGLDGRTGLWVHHIGSRTALDIVNPPKLAE